MTSRSFSWSIAPIRVSGMCMDARRSTSPSIVRLAQAVDAEARAAVQADAVPRAVQAGVAEGLPVLQLLQVAAAHRPRSLLHRQLRLRRLEAGRVLLPR